MIIFRIVFESLLVEHLILLEFEFLLFLFLFLLFSSFIISFHSFIHSFGVTRSHKQTFHIYMMWMNTNSGPKHLHSHQQQLTNVRCTHKCLLATKLSIKNPRFKLWVEVTLTHNSQQQQQQQHKIDFFSVKWNQAKVCWLIMLM